MVEAEKKIDENLYSRQIGAFGMKAMGRLIKMRVLIVGMRGLGVETAKNLILAGPASVHIYDNEVTTPSDLSSNFFLTEEHVKNKTSRGQACEKMLQELNTYVKVNVVTSLDGINDNYDCVVFTENQQGFADLCVVNNGLRAQGKGFIMAETLGAAGYCFVDFGDNH
jgi:ubiquitin-activating enzyme E1